MGEEGAKPKVEELEGLEDAEGFEVSDFRAGT
jgi:hypothetical protein